ncbi:Uncharacterised protein [Bordetella pertussis]|nr:Uncharacterised protein [Bordetella pertussis]CFP65418.1 Uncharacterised protein [Bordetella pertussis]CFW42881.1 Uncharacterised protein [Bordetella pertussis]
MPACASTSTTCCANRGDPSAGYCSWYRSAGKPPKSCQATWRSRVETARPCPIQCGETTSTARGRSGSPSLQAVSAGPVRPGSTASMGEPWETNNVGRRMATSGK